MWQRISLRPKLQMWTPHAKWQCAGLVSMALVLSNGNMPKMGNLTLGGGDAGCGDSGPPASALLAAAACVSAGAGSGAAADAAPLSQMAGPVKPSRPSEP